MKLVLMSMGGLTQPEWSPCTVLSAKNDKIDCPCLLFHCATPLPFDGLVVVGVVGHDDVLHAAHVQLLPDPVVLHAEPREPKLKFLQPLARRVELVGPGQSCLIQVKISRLCIRNDIS